MAKKPSYAELEARINRFEADVKDLHRTKTRLGASEEKFWTLWDQLPVACQSLDGQGRLVAVNPAWLTLLGYTREEVIGRSFGEFIPIEQASFNEKLSRIKAAGESLAGEFEIRKKEGARIAVSITENICRDLRGNVEQIHCILQEIPDPREMMEKNQADQELKDAYQQFLTVLNSMDATVYVSDMDTYEILFMNQYMKRLFGRDMTGEICFRAFRDQSAPCSFCPIPELKAGGRGGEAHCAWQDNNPIIDKWYMNYDRMIHWPDGRQVKLQIATDITPFKRMEDKLRRGQKMESMETLVGGVAHDFNNLLGVIMGNAELALDDTPEWSPVAGYLKEIKTAGLSAKDVVHQLLSFTRKTEVAQRPVNMTQVIRESLNLIQSSISPGIELKAEFDSSCPSIMGDSSQIQQLIINLYTNAAHALTDTGGEIRIRMAPVSISEQGRANPKEMKPGRYLALTVEDTGIGMVPSVREKIFDPYFTTKEVGQGSGLGLSAVLGILKSHNGHIRVESEPGKGSQFTVFFPVTHARPGQSDFDPLASGPEGSRAARILFVDDEVAIVKLMKMTLERLGFDVETQTCPEEALALVSKDPAGFDLVISDYTMPSMNGLDLTKKLKAIRPGLPVIICTGHSAHIAEASAVEAGADAYVLKPVSRSRIAQVIDGVLGRGG